MNKIIKISYMDSSHQYDEDGNAITTWDSKYCGWVINEEYENCEIDWIEDENGITEFPRGSTRSYFKRLYPDAYNNPVITVTWYWDKDGFKRFFNESVERDYINHSKTWEYLDYSKEEAIRLLGSYCGFNREAYKTVVSYNGNIIFDGKLDN